MATPPVTPNPSTPNAQGVSNPPAALPANTSTDPSQGASSAPDQGGAMSPGDMVSNAGASSVQPQTSSSTRTIPTSQQASVQPQTSSTNATIPTTQPQTKGGLPAASNVNSPHPTTVTPAAALSPTQPLPNAPGVIHAGLLRSIATALAGNPTKTVVDPKTGAVSQQPVPLSRADISLAIVSHMLSGAAAGLGVAPGPGNEGRAVAAGFGQVAQEQADASKQQADEAQQSFKNQVLSKNQQAVNMEAASRTILNTSQAQKLGLDTMKEHIAIDDEARQNAIDNGDVTEERVSQDDLLAGRKSGKYDPTKQSFYADGVTNLNGHDEATFTVANNPNRPVNMTQDQYDKFAAAGVAGFTAGTKIPSGGYQVKANMLDNWNKQVFAQSMMKQEGSKVVSNLASSPAYQEESKAVSDNLATAWKNPVFQRAMVTAQTAVSHSHPDENFADSVARLGAPQVQNADGKWVPNSAARISAAQVIYGGFGGGDPAKGKQFLQDEKDATTPVVTAKTINEVDAKLADPTLSPKDRVALQAARTQMLQDKAAGKVHGSKVSGGATDTPEVRAAALSAPDANGVNQTYLAALQKADPEQAASVRAAGEGRLTTSPSALRSKDGLKFQGQVNTAYPDWDWTAVHGYSALRTSYTSGKDYAKIQAANTTFLHAAQFAKNAGTYGSDIPGTTAYQTRKADTLQLTEEVNSAYTSGVLDEQKRAAIESGLASPRPAAREAAVKEYVTLLGDKMGAMQDSYGNAKPSKVIKDFPLINPQSAAAYQQVTGQSIDRYGRIGSGNNSSMNPNPNTPPVAGAIAGRSASGQIVAWKLPNGTIQKVGQ